MCPEFERVERIVQKMVDKSEKVFATMTYHHSNLRLHSALVPPSFDKLVAEPRNKDAQALQEIGCWL
jgi:hypothetical protein